MTEKDYNPEQKMKGKMSVETPKANKVDVKAPVKEDKKEVEEIKKVPEQEKPKEKKIIEVKKIKKTEAVVKGVSLPISTKHAVAICNFIRGRTIRECIDYLEDVRFAKKAIPMKGEIPHRKGMLNGKGIMSGRYPKNASESFIMILKSLGANANANGLENPVIVEAVANLASRPYGRFGRNRKKRTHLTIRVKDLPIKVKKKIKK